VRQGNQIGGESGEEGKRRRRRRRRRRSGGEQAQSLVMSLKILFPADKYSNREGVEDLSGFVDFMGKGHG